jgi:hypothetical protein
LFLQEQIKDIIIIKVLGVHIGAREISRSGKDLFDVGLVRQVADSLLEDKVLTIKCIGKRSRDSHIMANSLNKDLLSTNSEKL